MAMGSPPTSGVHRVGVSLEVSTLTAGRLVALCLKWELLSEFFEFCLVDGWSHKLKVMQHLYGIEAPLCFTGFNRYNFPTGLIFRRMGRIVAKLAN